MAMNDAQKLRIAFVLVVAQCFLFVMTLGFKAVMDVQAERHGISHIIEQAGK